jgi:hypothetical protein
MGNAKTLVLIAAALASCAAAAPPSPYGPDPAPVPGLAGVSAPPGRLAECARSGGCVIWTAAEAEELFRMGIKEGALRYASGRLR